MTTSNNKKNPCCTCIRVRDPQNCENKSCKEWQAWFVDRWEAMRRLIMAQANGKGIQGGTISVGGAKYHHPERVREFLESDPCLKCVYGEGLCLQICATRQVWLEAKERNDELESGSGKQIEKI